MARRKYIIIFAVLIWFLPFSGQGQFEELNVLLEGKERFSDITATVEQYLLTVPESEEKQKFEKQYARWAYFQSLHLGPDGEFVNVAKRTFEAIQDRVEDPSMAVNGDWSFVGPNATNINNPGADLNGNGRADRIAFHPTDPDIFYVGTPSGGLWKTTDRGLSWEAISNYIPSLGISGIVVDHSDPNRLFVLTGDGDTYNPNAYVSRAGYHRLSVGVLVSNDGGDSWQQTGHMYGGDYVGFRLIQHPVDPDILLAATSVGIYKTTNGHSWSFKHGGLTYDLEFRPSYPNRVFASGIGSFAYSADTGNTWYTNSSFDYPLCNPGRTEIAVTPDNTWKVYLLAGPKGAGNDFCGFYESNDRGISFTRLCNSPNVFGKEDGTKDQSDYDIGLAVSPSDDQIIVAGGLITYRSTDGGDNFAWQTSYREGGGNYIHPDIHALEYNPLNEYLYALGDGGIHESTDYGQTYTDIYDGLNTAQFYGMDDYDNNQNALLAGCQDNGIKYRTSNTSTFSHIYCCDGTDCIINYTDQTEGYAVVNSNVKKYSHFTDDAPSTLLTPGFFAQIELNTSDPTLVYIGYNRVRSYSTSTGWKWLGGPDIKGWWALKTCNSNYNRIYAAGGDSFSDDEGEMFHTADGGTTWYNISDNSGFPTTYNRISDIGVYPSLSSHVWVSFSGYTDEQKVYYSDNRGTDWVNKSFDLPNIPVWTIVVDAGHNVYVGTDAGVYYLAFGGTNWEPFYNYLPNAPVAELAYNPDANILYAATFGRGIWKSFTQTCPSSTYIDDDMEGQYFRSVSSFIQADSKVVGGEGTNAVLRAGDYVRMLPGFQADAEPGNKFLAYIGDCGDGMPPELSFGGPILPEVLRPYTLNFSREKGTIAVSPPGRNPVKITLRLFQNGKARLILADARGNFIKDIASFSGEKGQYRYLLETKNLQKELHFLYLIFNDKVMHLQELWL